MKILIAENVKVLKFVFPLILIFTIIAPIGSFLTIISFTYNLNIPYCIFHIFNNAPHLLICIRYWIINSRKGERSAVSDISKIKNVMGKVIPLTNGFDDYFNNLQQSWK
uniref:Uncharacterized protein n=1 Tax=Panagrolaimus sp. PS1159 TaxID=55785 RepID=A0AC35FJT6_9BILA